MAQTWIDALVTAKRTEAKDISIIELAGANVELPDFSAGAHIDVEIAPNLVRQYSLSNNPHGADRYVLAILREPASRGGSAYLHDKLQIGDIVRISEPRNHFALVPTSPRSLLFAGGIGITPILSMAERLHHISGSFEMHYCAHTRARAAFADYIASSPFSQKAHLHFSDGPVEQKLDLKTALKPDGYTHLYVCGPMGFIKWILDTARELGWPSSRLHREYFAAAAIEGEDKEFHIQIARTGEIFTVPPSASVAQTLRQHGIEVAVSCEQGLCGACLTRVLDGDIEHRDHFLTDEEHAANDQFTACCSRGKGPLLILDL